jgi:hypothetical protein
VTRKKARQIGGAVTEYQSAKIDAAHVQTKVERIFMTYRLIGETMNKKHGSTTEPKIKDGNIIFGYAGSSVSASDLLNEADLLILIQERDKARERLVDARKVLDDLGITGIS